MQVAWKLEIAVGAYSNPKDARFRGWEMPYQYVREPLTAEESDRLSNACETPAERLVVWALLDTGLRVGELCRLTSKNVLWQPRQLRIKGKGGPAGASPGRRAPGDSLAVWKLDRLGRSLSSRRSPT